MTARIFEEYRPIEGAYDETFDASGAPRAALRHVVEALETEGVEAFVRAQAAAERALLQQGVTFSVYTDQRGVEKIFPFCLLPRVVAADEFAALERGIQQRIVALGLFLDDVYGPQRILAEGVVPRELVLAAKGYLPQLHGVAPPGGVRIHVSGVDLIRDGQGVLRVLEDNLRVPSGVSYVVENRLVSKRFLPRVFEAASVNRVDHYPAKLAETLASVSPPFEGDAPCIVVLTPGPYNSAYFEHSFLARTMGVELVQAQDLFVDDDRVFLKTTRGPKRVHVIYRRIDEAFLDPEVFRPDSLLGVPGVIRAYRKGNVALANAPGNGIADDKAIYPYVPDMIRFYLKEEPLLAQVPTWVCDREADRAFVLEHLDELVVKAVDEAGGYGMLMGPTASKAEREEFARRIVAEPRRYIAQRRVEISSAPTWIGGRASSPPGVATADAIKIGRAAPRRVDLRPYVLTGPRGPWVLPGGLTRVALAEGSYVVNSSQGGGSKDTWVLKGRA